MAMARAHATTTQNCGPLPGSCIFAATRVSVITPMVFCASLVPCASAISEEEAICAWRNLPRPSFFPSWRRVML